MKGTPPYAGYDTTVTPRFWRWPYWDKHSFYFSSHTALGEHGYLKTRLYYDVFENSLWAYDDATYSSFTKRSSFKSRYDDYTYGFSVEAGTTLVPHNDLKLAIHFKDDVHREANQPNPLQHFEDQLYSIGLEDTIRLGEAFTVVAGVGYDALETIRAQNYSATTKTFSDFPQGDASAWNPQLGLFYKAPTGGVAHATVARKSHLPTIKDRYSYRLGTALPNPDLQPERSTNFELGYQDHLPGKVKVAGTAFLYDLTDYILLAAVPDPSNPSKTLNQNQNVGKVRQVGGELEVAAPLGSLADVSLCYTRIHVDNRTSSQKITGIPEHKLFGYLRLTPVATLSALVSGEYD